MLDPKAFEELSARVSAMIAASPAGDIEKNLRAILASGFSRMNLVTREDFDIQCALLASAREKLATLENRIAEIEARHGGKSGI